MTASLRITGSGRLEKKDFSLEDVRPLFPQAAEFSRWFESKVYRVKNEEGELEGFVAEGPPGDENIRGFAGRVPFLIAMDADLIVREVRMLPNRETPQYAHDVSENLSDAWSGMSPEEALEARVDAVSGATHTSRALIEGVRLTLASINQRQVDITGHPLRAAAALSAFDFITLAFLGLAVLYFFSRKVSARIGKPVMLFLSLLIPGLIAANMLSIALFAGWIRGDFLWSSHIITLIIALPAAVIPLFTGRNFYCYNFCPFGAAQQLAYKIKTGDKLRTGKRVRLVLKWLQIAILSSAAALIALDISVNPAGFEPFAAFRWGLSPRASRIIFVASLVTAVWIPRSWCRICPTGCIINALKKKKLKKD